MNGEGISSEVINISNGLLLVINYHRISGGSPWVKSMNEPKDRNQADCRLITFLHTGPGVNTGKVLIKRSFSIKWIYASVNTPVMENGGRAILTASYSCIVVIGWSMLCNISSSLFTVQPVSFSNHFFLSCSFCNSYSQGDSHSYIFELEKTPSSISQCMHCKEPQHNK